jgi:nitrate reductase assembly molybdenum cofactor insertion protein NarJ
LLEFMAAAPQAETHAPVLRCLAAVPALAGRLKESGSLYAVPLELLCGVFPETTDVPLSPAGATPAGASGA